MGVRIVEERDFYVGSIRREWVWRRVKCHRCCHTAFVNDIVLFPLFLRVRGGAILWRDLPRETAMGGMLRKRRRRREDIEVFQSHPFLLFHPSRMTWRGRDRGGGFVTRWTRLQRRGRRISPLRTVFVVVVLSLSWMVFRFLVLR